MKWKRLDFYRKGMLFMLPLAAILLAFILISNPWDLLLSEWFLDILIVPTFLGTLVSSAGYLGRALDAVSVKPSAGKAERFGTCLGLAAGLLLGISLCFLRRTIPLVNTLHELAYIIFTLGNISSFAGLGNRIGSFIDDNDRPNCEKRAIATVSLIGLGVGLGLFFTNNAALVCIAGVTSFFTGGVALPVILCGIIFAVSFSGLCASCTDYFAKAGSYLRSGYIQDKQISTNVKEKFHEYQGSTFGVATGLVVSAIIISALAITQPHLFVAGLALITTTIVVTACVSVLGGLFSRVGRILDARIAIQKAQEIEMMPLASEKKSSENQLGSPSHKIIADKMVELDVHSSCAKVSSSISSSVFSVDPTHERDKCAIKVLAQKNYFEHNSCSSAPVVMDNRIALKC